MIKIGFVLDLSYCYCYWEKELYNVNYLESEPSNNWGGEMEEDKPTNIGVMGKDDIHE